MEELKVIDLYQKTPDKTLTKFKNRTNSSLQVVSDYEKVDSDTEWITIMEDTIRYIDNILRNPNRFIVNEEDIVKIELARRVTVESIKHLARNTNLIQDYDKKTGDVKPSKILNINKEESYNTYENRFIYSLIQNMKGFIARKKAQGIKESKLKNNKKFEYNASARVGEEQIDVNMSLNSKLNSSSSNKDENGLTIPERIEKLELQISDLTNSDVYKTLAKLHVALVTSPIKKTNVILKNVNFQYAVKLWNYMQENLDDHSSCVKKNQNYQDNGELKDYVDETFLLNYLVMNTLNGNKTTESEKQEISERLIGNVIEKIIDIDSTISEEQLKNIGAKQYAVVKYKQVTSVKRIEELFDKKIDKYLKRVNNLKI